MNVATRVPMTMAQFLEWEARQAFKQEFDGMGPVPMTGARVAHVVIQGNILAALLAMLRGTPRRPYGSDLQLRSDQRVRYPDVMVVCSPLANDGRFADDPTVVFEIVSPITVRTDRTAKPREYWDISSKRDYVLVEQEFVSALHNTRGPDNWRTTLVGPDDTLSFPGLGVSLPLVELYEGLTFPDTGAE